MIRDIGQHTHQSSIDPTVAAPPENRPSFRGFLVKERLVAHEKTFLFAIEKVHGVPIEPMEQIEVALLAGGGVHAREDSRSHVERVCPPPQVTSDKGTLRILPTCMAHLFVKESFLVEIPFQIGLDIGNHERVFLFQVDIEIGLGDTNTVGMKIPAQHRPALPFGGLAPRFCAIVKDRIPSRLVRGIDPCIERSSLPTCTDFPAERLRLEIKNLFHQIFDIAPVAENFLPDGIRHCTGGIAPPLFKGNGL